MLKKLIILTHRLFIFVVKGTDYFDKTSFLVKIKNENTRILFLCYMLKKIVEIVPEQTIQKRLCWNLNSDFDQVSSKCTNLLQF